MLRESFEGRLVDTDDDVTHVDSSTLSGRLPREKLLHSDHAEAVTRGVTGVLVREGLLSTEAEP